MKCVYCGRKIDSKENKKYIRIPKGAKSVYFCNQNEYELFKSGLVTNVYEKIDGVFSLFSEIVPGCTKDDLVDVLLNEEKNKLQIDQIGIYIKQNLNYLKNIISKKEFTTTTNAIKYLNAIFQNNSNIISKLKEKTFVVSSFDCDSFYSSIEEQSVVIKTDKKKRRTIQELEEL